MTSDFIEIVKSYILHGEIDKHKQNKSITFSKLIKSVPVCWNMLICVVVIIQGRRARETHSKAHIHGL